jgi:hypothetical protein
MYLAILQWIGIVFSFSQSELPYLGIVTIYFAHLKNIYIEREMQEAGRPVEGPFDDSIMIGASYYTFPSIDPPIYP